MMVKTYPTYSVVPSKSIADPEIQRAPNGANPVNAPGNRETAPLAAGAPPRVKHPKLNAEPWSVTYGQARSQPKSTTAKSKGAKLKAKLSIGGKS